MIASTLYQFLCQMEEGQAILDVHHGPPLSLALGEIVSVSPEDLIFEWHDHNDPAWTAVVNLQSVEKGHWGFGEYTASFYLPNWQPYSTWCLQESDEYTHYLDLIEAAHA